MSLILAKILGIFFVAMGLAFFLRPQHLKNLCEQCIEHQKYLFLGAASAIATGAVLISLHNLWVFNWPIIITLLGWWSLIKGFSFLAYPEAIQYFKFALGRSRMFYRSMSLAYIVLGLFLTYKGLGF